MKRITAFRVAESIWKDLGFIVTSKDGAKGKKLTLGKNHRIISQINQMAFEATTDSDHAVGCALQILNSQSTL